MPAFKHSDAFLGITSKWFNNQATSDLEVHLKNDKVLYCHRLVLCSWSDVWAAALEDKKERSLDLTSYDETTVEKCLRYCYTSTIDFEDDDLTRVHWFAHKFNLQELEKDCEKKITQSIGKGLSAMNCMVLYCYLLENKFPNLPDALQSIKAFVCKEFVAASESSGFLRVPEKVLCQLLQEDGLVTTEDDVLDACCRWLAESGVGTDPQVRDRVMQLVRFPMLSGKKLLEFKSNPMMKQSDALVHRHHFALEWVMTRHVPASDQEPLRIKLAEENKTEILTPRVWLSSQILDADMTRTLAAMLGGAKQTRLLVNSSSGTTAQVFDNAVRGQGPFLCIIKSGSGHVFGAYVEDTATGNWVPGSPNNFLFSLKAIHPQQVVKLKRSGAGCGVYIAGCGLHMGDSNGLIAFCSHSTANDPAFELAPGYEAVGSKTLHGTFGYYTPSFMEVFATS